jgi:hypothetical protein
MMSVPQHVDFLNGLGSEIKNNSVQATNTLRGISENERLTKEGRIAMGLIGDFADMNKNKDEDTIQETTRGR